MALPLRLPGPSSSRLSSFHTFPGGMSASSPFCFFLALLTKIQSARRSACTAHCFCSSADIKSHKTTAAPSREPHFACCPLPMPSKYGGVATVVPPMMTVAPTICCRLRINRQEKLLNPSLSHFSWVSTSATVCLISSSCSFSPDSIVLESSIVRS